MIKAKTFIGLALTVGTLLSTAAPAFAEFESLTGTSQGKVEPGATIIENKTARVECLETEELPTHGTWTIKNEKEAATKGPHLLMAMEKWGECQMKTMPSKGSQLKLKATLSSCELEITQKAEEESVPMAIISTCTIKAEAKTGACEIKIEPKSNSQLKAVSLYNSPESFGVVPSVTSVTATVNLGCEAIGVTGGNSWGGSGIWWTARVLLILAAQPEIVIGGKPLVYAAGQEGTVTITRIAGVSAAPQSLGGVEKPAGTFIIPNALEHTECQTGMLALGETCKYTVRNVTRGSSLDFVMGANGAEASVRIRRNA
jgi:hypothetical protein